MIYKADTLALQARTEHRAAQARRRDNTKDRSRAVNLHEIFRQF